MPILRICRGMERAIARLGALVAWVTLIPLIAVSVYDIVGRQFFNTGSTLLQELEWHLFLALVMLCLGYAYVQDAHVRIDLLRGHLQPRTRALIELLGCLFVLLPFCLVLLVYGSETAYQSFLQMERSRAPLGLPFRWIIKAVVPAGGLLLLLAGLSIAIRNLLYLRGRATETAPGTGS